MFSKKNNNGCNNHSLGSIFSIRNCNLPDLLYLNHAHKIFRGLLWIVNMSRDKRCSFPISNNLSEVWDESGWGWKSLYLSYVPNLLWLQRTNCILHVWIRTKQMYKIGDRLCLSWLSSSGENAFSACLLLYQRKRKKVNEQINGI